MVIQMSIHYYHSAVNIHILDTSRLSAYVHQILA